MTEITCSNPTPVFARFVVIDFKHIMAYIKPLIKHRYKVGMVDLMRLLLCQLNTGPYETCFNFTCCDLETMCKMVEEIVCAAVAQQIPSDRK